MPNRQISREVFQKFVADNGWMEIYNEESLNLVRYITPLGVQVDATFLTNDTVEVEAVVSRRYLA